MAATACAKLQEPKLIAALRQADRDIRQKDACHTLRQSAKLRPSVCFLSVGRKGHLTASVIFLKNKTNPLCFCFAIFCLTI